METNYVVYNLIDRRIDSFRFLKVLHLLQIVRYTDS